MENLFSSIINSGFLSTYDYENQLYLPLTYHKNISISKIKNINLPQFNIISDTKSKKCAIMIFFNVGYYQESQNKEYTGFIKLILNVIFENENSFNKLFPVYNLKYDIKIDIEKTIIYFDFDYSGIIKIFNSFIEVIFNFENLLVKINKDELLANVSMINCIDTEYIAYNKIIIDSLQDIKSDDRNQNIFKFFEKYVLKNNNIQFSFLLPYSIEKSKEILEKKLQQLVNKIRIKTPTNYDKYESEKINVSFEFSEPLLIITKKIDFSSNNIMKLVFFFPSLNYEEQNVLEYISYMIKGNKPGSFYYDIYKRKYIQNLEVYPVYNIKTPSQLIIRFKLYNNFNFYIFKFLLAKLINFLKVLKSGNKLIEEIYETFQKLLLKKYMFKNYNNNKDNYYSELYNFTNNYLIINSKNKEKNDKSYHDNNINFLNILSKKYILPKFDFNLIQNILKNLIDLNNLLITIELFPKSLIKLESLDDHILKNKKTNDYNNYLTGRINKNYILNLAIMAENYDILEFNIKKNKMNYLSKEKYTIQIGKKTNNKIQLIFNNISNKLWCKFDYDIKYPKIISSFHIIYPNIRSNEMRIDPINLKYFYQLNKLIQIEFVELLDVKDDNFYINLSKDENGLNLQINTYKDIYLLVIKKIFSFIFEFDKNIPALIIPDNYSSINDNQISKALSYLKKVIKKEINEKYFQEINKQFNFNDINSYAYEISQNMHIDGFLYGFLDNNLIKEVRNILFIYNTREYDYYSFFEDIPNFKKRIYDYKKIKEGNIHVYKLRQNFDEDNTSYYLSFYQLNDYDKNKELFIIIIYLLLKEYLPKGEIYKIFTDNIYYILIINKSFDSPELVAKYIYTNIKYFVDIISNKKNLELKKIILSFKEEINNEINNLNNKYNYIWNQIYYDQYSFEQYDNLNDIYNNFCNLKSNESNLWIDEFKNYLKDNLILKQRKVEFLFYKDSIKVTNDKNENIYPWNSYINENYLNVFNYYSLEYIKE